MKILYASSPPASGRHPALKINYLRMKIVVVICLFALIVSIPNPCSSQDQVEISGVKYILHNVKKSETVFSLCQKYKVTQKDILQANPGLSAILQTGSTVKIPVKKMVPEEPVKVEAARPAQVDAELYYKILNTANGLHIESEEEERLKKEKKLI